METAEQIQRRLKTTEDLKSVVGTMKALAAVNIRKYERAVESLRDFTRAVELGLTAVLKAQPGLAAASARRGRAGSPLGLVIFGSDQGMAGAINESVAQAAGEELDQAGPDGSRLLVVGERLRSLMEDQYQAPERFLLAPTSVPGIGPAVTEVLLVLDHWQERQGVERVVLVHNQHQGGAAYQPVRQRLLPLDQAWIAEVRQRPWPRRGVPGLGSDWPGLFAALVRQHLFGLLFQAFAEALASENASRLAAMQNAERNIDERLGELRTQYFQTRQSAITEELLDIVSGFEALAKAGDASTGG